MRWTSRSRGRGRAALGLAVLASGALAALGARFLAGARSFEGQVVLVCGGSRGLGRALARAFAERGAHVAICGRDAVDLADARAELERIAVARATRRRRAPPAEVLARTCDLRDREQLAELVAYVSAHLGPIDVLVANAATIEVGPVEVLGVEAFERAMRDIFMTALGAALAVVPSMRARRSGTVAFIASIGGRMGVPHLAPYSAAKFAELGFAEALRAEVARDGVRVLTVIPGLMRTGSYAHARFVGDPEKEYLWFTAGATTPLVAMDAARAAQRIVAAIARGDRELVFTAPARLAYRLHNLAPGLFARASELAARLLPVAPAEPVVLPREGAAIEDTSPSPLVTALADRGRAQGKAYGQWG